MYLTVFFVLSVSLPLPGHDAHRYDTHRGSHTDAVLSIKLFQEAGE